MSEPQSDVPDGGGLLPTFRRLFQATRPQFFTASLFPVALGTVAGVTVAGAFDGVACFLAVVATVCVHGATNVLNDVYDDASGNDQANHGRIHPFTGGSRFIQNGVLDRAAMRRLGLALLALGLLVGLVLAGMKGQEVIVLGTVGIMLGVLYSAPPVRLSARGLGELAVGVGFGPLPVVGAAWLQSGTVDLGVVALSLPVGCWIANVLLINEVPDAPADAAVGRRTLAVRLDRPGTAILYMAINGAAVLATVWAATLGVVPFWAVAGPVLLLVLARRGWAGIRSQSRDALKGGIVATLAVHVLGSLWLVGSVLLS